MVLKEKLMDQQNCHKTITIHPEGNMNVCIIFTANSPNNCQDIDKITNANLNI